MPQTQELDLEALANDLRAALEGEVRFDEISRLLYATDASIYQIMPIGVIVPRHAADVQHAVRIAAKHGVPVLPRGSGTGLAGQTVGAALVLDFTKHLNQILELNAAERWVRVQPGVVLDELNAYLKPHGLAFAPDVATSNRASIGGMMGNNSCGAHSILYGRTVEHVLEQRVVLADGSSAHFAEVSLKEWDRRATLDTLEGRIYQGVRRICEEQAEEVEARFPRIMRRVGGYNLDEMVRNQRWNLAKLAVGAEGTLVAVTEAKLNLVPLPAYSGLLVSHFDDLIAALRSVTLIVSREPAAVELIDRIILDLTRDNRTLALARSFLCGDPDAIMVTEFYADTPQELESRLGELRQALEAAGHGYAHVPLIEAADKKKVWDVRKAGVGVLMGMKGDAKPAGFVEDTAVPVEVLADYISDFRALLAEYGLEACFYAHASVGCLHARPILNLKSATDQRRMREIASRVADLVLHYGGVMSAEHGDGLARSEWQERMFGPQLYQAFRELKRVFDPQGIMNPGKIVDAPPMNHHLRMGNGFRMLPVDTTLDFSRDGGFGAAVEMCSGVGACRKNLDGAMCPSFRATREEMHSTRGRANILRMVLSGQAAPEDPGAQGAPGVRGSEAASAVSPKDPMADERIREVLDLCLECKACKSECPSNVDMAKLKYEFLSHYHHAHGTPWRARVFAHVAKLSRMGAMFAPVANWMQELPFVRGLMDSRLGIDRRRTLPRYAEQTFDAWWRLHRPPAESPRGEVALFVDTFANYQEPEIARAAVRVLEAFGYRVRVPTLRCCGRPMISKGLLQEARENAELNVRALAPLVREGIPVIGLEPSCLITFLDEYREFRLGDAADVVAADSWMLEDFLAARHGSDTATPFRETPRRVLVHGHCHQKALLGTSRMLQALRLVPGYQVEEIKSGCCGMAGTFGYEKEHYDLSLQIGELSVFPPIRSAAADTLLVAPGTSCRHQIHDATGRSAVHPAQALALALAEEPV
ncbi:MAG: FAD-binding and (Fe-S)-binding domain-containing protein [Actinomycetota bacterium]